MPLYEWKHIMDPEYFVVEKKTDFSYPLHIHYCFEIILITEGEMEVTVDGRLHRLKAGEAAFIFPNQIHALHTPAHSRHTLCVFSPDLVGRYAKAVGQDIPRSNTLMLREEPVMSLFRDMTSQDSLYRVKGILYILCGAFMEQAAFDARRSAPGKKEALLHAVLDFIHRSFMDDCSLKQLSSVLKYDYAYLSKFFIANVGIPFNEYVNQLRISHACYLLSDTDRGILTIAEASGFPSLRTFNRNFQRCTGQTPRQYRLQSREAVRKTDGLSENQGNTVQF